MNVKQCVDFINEIDNDFISLYSLWENHIFDDINFCEIESLIPLWLSEGGRSCDSTIDKETFEEYITHNNNELTHRILYFYDVQNILSALQDRIQSVKYIISELYKIVSYHPEHSEIDNIIMQMDDKASIAHVLINAVFVNLSSALDLFTKFVYEIENIEHVDFSTYKQIRSHENKIIFMKYNPLHEDLKCKDMIFYKPVCRTLNLIRTLRNEYVHNDAWNYRGIIYKAIKRDDVVDTFILLPDMDENGNFIASKSRNKFYSKEEKINFTLLDYIMETMKIFQNTINKLKELYPIKEFNNNSKIMDYVKEIEQWRNMEKFIDGHDE